MTEAEKMYQRALEGREKALGLRIVGLQLDISTIGGGRQYFVDDTVDRKSRCCPERS